MPGDLGSFTKQSFTGSWSWLRGWRPPASDSALNLSTSIREVRQFHMAHVLRQTGFEVCQTILFFLGQFLGGLGGQAPAILVNHGVAVARGCLEKALIAC